MTLVSRRALTLAGFATIAVLSTAAAPVRHLELRRAEPAADSTVSSAPIRIALYFSAKPNVRISSVKLAGPTGDALTLGPLTLDTARGAPLVAPITGSLTPGRHTVSWQTASSDGHPIKGTFVFTYTPRSIK